MLRKLVGQLITATGTLSENLSGISLGRSTLDMRNA
ncbi:hypothetical protein ARSEF1564_009565 [Beauveria bassiana]